MAAPTPIASAAFNSQASVASICASTGGAALSSFTYDTGKGTFLPATSTRLTLLNINNYTQCTGDWCLRFKLEHSQICTDESTGTGTVIFDSLNPVQVARTPADFCNLLRISDNTTADFFLRMYYGSGGIYFHGYTVSSGGSSANVFSTMNSNDYSDEWTDTASGTLYADIYISRDTTQGVLKIWMNGRLKQTITPASGFAAGNVLLTNIDFNVNNGGTKLGAGAWLKDVALYNQKYDPVVFARENTGKTISIACGPDSFWLQALSSSAEYGAGYMCKAILESQFGIRCNIINGLEENGQGYQVNGLSNAEIDSVTAQRPTFVILTPTVNDLALASAAFSIGPYATWAATVENVVNRLGASGVGKIIVAPMWPWVQAGTGPGFGGTNTRCTAFYTDPALIKVMNSFFINLPNNANITTSTKAKLIVLSGLSDMMGCDAEGKNYNRNYTLGSHSTLRDPTNLHPSNLAHIKMASALADVIGNIVSSSPATGITARGITTNTLTQ